MRVEQLGTDRPVIDGRAGEACTSFDGGAASGASGQKLFELTGGWTVPQILIDDKPIGGYVELRRLDRDGKLAA